MNKTRRGGFILLKLRKILPPSTNLKMEGYGDLDLMPLLIGLITTYLSQKTVVAGLNPKSRVF